MNEFVELSGEPELTANSLILIGLTLRTFSAVDSDRVCSVVELFHEALPTRSPLKALGPEVTLKVALTVAPGATGSGNVFDVSVVPETTAVQSGGAEMLNLTLVAGAPVVLVNVTVDSCDEPGEKVWSPGGCGARRRRRQAQRRHIVLGSHNIGLHLLIRGVGRERAGGRHRAFIERALRAVAVVAAIAQQDRPLLAHRIIGGC